MTATLEILKTGPLALVEDLGRPGLAHMGVSRSGAADRRSHALANRLVANPNDRATIEVTFGGFSARVHGGGKEGVAVAVTGADADPSANGKLFGTNSIHYAHDGDVISLGAPHTGMRSYVAVRGGFKVDPVLGSCSYDVMSAIGPRPLQVGDMLTIGEHTAEFPELDQAPVAAIAEDLLELLVVPGPRDDWFVDPDALGDELRPRIARAPDASRKRRLHDDPLHVGGRVRDRRRAPRGGPDRDTAGLPDGLGVGIVQLLGWGVGGTADRLGLREGRLGIVERRVAGHELAD